MIPKCEVIGNGTACHTRNALAGFMEVAKDEAMLLGSPLMQGKQLDIVLHSKCTELELAMSRLHLIKAHYALTIIRNCISAPKLMYILRTSACFDNVLLVLFDDLLRIGLEEVLNIQLLEPQWLQVTLPVREGGLGIRSVVHLATSAFLASAVSTRTLQNQILPSFSSIPDKVVDLGITKWSSLTNLSPIEGSPAGVQRSWDGCVVAVNRQRLLSLCPSELDQARILAASAPHSGDWIHAIPSDNCGLLLDDETLRIAVGVRLGSALCLPYTCICGASIDEKCLHSFACKKNSGRYIRHSILNDVIWRSLSRAKIYMH